MMELSVLDDGDVITKVSEMHGSRKHAVENSKKWKETGNNKVKLGEYEEAINAYTRAIAHCDSDPAYYANRALCYLRLEKYDKCIEDCKRAIDLDSSKIKAFYRMMQAYEALWEVDMALGYCRKVLALNPSNKEAQKSLQRLEGKICANKVNCSSTAKLKSSAVWSRTEPINFERIKLVDKSLHMRSQLQLKRIKIFETPGMRNNNDEGKSAIYAVTEKKIQNVNQLIKNSNFIAPSSSSHFYSTWKELVSDDEKFAYLNFIGTKNLNRTLGACFDYDTLAEFIALLDKFFAAHKRKALDLLIELGKHDQIRILSMFLSTRDLQALERLLLELEREGLDKIDNVKHGFCLKK